MIAKKNFIILSCLVLAACGSDKPRIIEPSSDMPEVRLRGGLATQIEMPAPEHVISVVTGDPSLVTAERADSVVNLIPKQGSGETNLIVRSLDEDGRSKLYQYRVIVQER